MSIPPAPQYLCINEGRVIRVIGATGAGKTSVCRTTLMLYLAPKYYFMQFINAASSSSLQVGHGLQSCTSEVNFSEPFFVNGRKVVLFDTPGFDDTNRSDVEILTEIAAFLTKL